ncbi:MAG: sialidase family protein [Bryobacteraceae bacterium]
MKRLSLLLLVAVPLCGQLERYVAIDNVCAWPNLTLLPGGQILAHIHNRPSHGLHEGDIETWASEDGGALWKLRGVPAPHGPGTTRIHAAAGLTHDGSLVVVTTGWGGEKLRGHILKPWVSRSSDGGRTWQRSESVTLPPGTDQIIAFGNVVRMTGRQLAVPVYSGKRSPNPTATGSRDQWIRSNDSWLLFSQDDGHTWGNAALIGRGQYNETAVLRLRADRWLAAARTLDEPGALELFVSEDEGRHWKNTGPVTLPSHHPGHLLRLSDGRILLTYGIRERWRYSSTPALPESHQGVGIRISRDEGKTWSSPARLVTLPETGDGGYPATVQLADGALVTAYYSNGIPTHRRYHMGVVRWRLPE